jgi:hypothetical protein
MKKITYILIFSLFSYKSIANEICSPHPELEFFNKLGGQLEIQLSEQTVPINPKVANRKATSNATIKGVVMKGEFYESDEIGYRDLLKSELDQIAFNGSSIILSGAGNEPVEHQASNKSFFTVKELFKAIEITELKTRHKTDWFGGINVHHVYFEGIECQNGTWLIYWGS